MLSLTENDHCCAAGSKDSGRPLRTVAEWVLPGGVLLLIPKCPLCIVAYVAMFTGFGLSVSAAANIRIGLITLCSAALVFLVARFFIRA